MFRLSRPIAPVFMRRLPRLLVVPLVALGLGLRPPLAAHAAGTIVVDSLADNVKPDRHCTLREAIIAANTNAPVDSCAAGGEDEDIITFSVSGTIILTTRLPGISVAANPNYSGPSQPLTIRGPGADRLTISGNNAVGILVVNGWLNLENVTIANSNASNGGAIFNGGNLNITNSILSGSNALDGGAILNRGNLNITNSSFSGNRASGQSGCEYRKDLGTYVCSYHGGGAIFNDHGEVNVTGSTFSDNSADRGDGGAIFNATESILNITNSTFASNHASSGNGGGINSFASLNVTNSTFVGNTAAAGGGLYIWQNSFESVLKNTIIADSFGGNCRGPIVPSGTDNLVTDASCGPSAKKTSSAALNLSPLQNNGGPTKTIAPQAGSIVIDAGDPATCAAEPVSNRDQRGEVRPQGLGCDVGSVEVKVSYYPPVAKEDSYTTVANPAQPLHVDAAHGLLANDYDQDGDTLQAVLSSEPSHGKLVFNADGSFSYSPSTGFEGTDSFTYRASDGSNDSDPATVTIIVGRLAAADDSYRTAPDTVLTVGAPGVLANDAQADGKPLLAKLIDEPRHGKLTLNDNGSFIYIPEEGFRESDSFVYVASDGTGESNTATVAITIAP